MTISTTPASGERQGPGTFQAVESLTQSTATTPQALSVITPVSILGMGTATGTALRNLYTLGTAVEGFEKVIVCQATGEASVIMTQPSGRIFGSIDFALASATDVDAAWASATGQYVFQADGDMQLLRFIDDQWVLMMSRGATLATTT